MDFFIKLNYCLCKKGDVCEQETVIISCDFNTNIIIKTASWGLNLNNCIKNNISCNSTDVKNEISKNCDNKKMCNITAYISILNDPCKGALKSLKIIYDCESNIIL